MSRKDLKIKDCLPLVQGLWFYINYELPEIFDLEPSQLDVLFLSNWAERKVAPIVNLVREQNNTQDMLDAQELGTLADLIKGMYKNKWDKMMAVATMEYDPIHNYYDELTETVNYEEEGGGTKTAQGSDSRTRTDNLSEQMADGRTITETRNLSNSGSDTNAHDVYGFNSSSAVHDDKDTGSSSNTEAGTIGTVHSGNMTTTNTGTQTHAGTNSNSETDTNEKTGERSREYLKTGNIGNISTQKLMNEELELWKYNFIYEMMRDVAKCITLPIYETPNY